MKILNRYKKKEMDGFQEYVMDLEATPQKRRAEKFFNAALEDPIYMSWVAKNLLDADHILNIDSGSFMELVKNTKGIIRLLAMGFGKHPLEEKLFKIMSPKMKTDYDFELEILLKDGLDLGKQESAQSSLIRAFRLLLQANVLGHFPWRLPPLNVVRINKIPPTTGPVEVRFEDGKTALRGNLLRTLRDGLWDHYYPNGQLMARGTYVEDDKSGPWKVFYPDGKIKGEGNYRTNNKHGPWKEYDTNGECKTVQY